MPWISNIFKEYKEKFEDIIFLYFSRIIVSKEKLKKVMKLVFLE